MSSATFPFSEASEARAAERRLSIAIGVSFLIHALVLGTLRGVLPTVRTFAEGGVGSVPALQALLAGPPVEPEHEEPVAPEPAINPDLVAPPAAHPVETLYGRTPPATTPVPGGGPAKTGPTTPEASVAVGMIPDPARLGPDYVAQLAQRYPDPVQRTPLLLGAPVVPYPRAALETGLQGRFAAVVAVDALGKVTDARLAVDDALFGPAMLEALRSAEFAPAQYDGSAVPYWAIVEFIFTIGKPDEPPSAAQPVARSRAPAPSSRRRPGS